MGNDLSSAVYRGLGMPLPLREGETFADRIVVSGGDAGASYTAAGPVPGAAQMGTENRGDLRLLTSGEIDGDMAPVSVIVARSGLPGRSEQSQGIVWLHADEAPRGHDEANAISAWAAIEWLDGSGDPVEVRYPDILGAPNGTLVIVALVIRASGDREVWGWHKFRGGTWSAASIFNSDSDDTGLHPCLWWNPETGNLYCAHWVSGDDADTDGVSIRMYRSHITEPDRWTIIERRALIDRTPEPAQCYRLRAAYWRGVLTLVTSEHEAGAGESELWQYTCPGEAGRLTLAGDGSITAAAGRFHALLPTTAGLSLLYIARAEVDDSGVDCDRKPVRKTIGTPAEAFVDVQVDALYDWVALYFAVLNDLGTRERVSDGDLAATVDSRGVAWCYVRETAAASSLPGACWCLRSEDGGLTWTGPTLWYNQDDDATHPEGFAAAPELGRIILVGNHASDPGNEDLSLSAIYLGGWTSLPRWPTTALNRLQEGWDVTWLPYDVPVDCGWTETLAGVTGAYIHADGVLFVSTIGGGVRCWEREITAAALRLDHGAAFEVHLDAVTGGSMSTLDVGVELLLDDGTDAVHIQIRIEENGARVYDALGTTALGDISIDFTAPVALVGGLRRRTNGTAELLIWARPDPASADRVFDVTTGTQSVQAQPTVGATTGGDGYLRWGNIASATATSRWTLVMMHDACSLTWAAGALLGGDEYHQVRAAAVGPDPITLPSGLQLSAEGGTGVVLDTATVTVDAEYAVARAFPEVESSPRLVWRSLDDASDIIVPVTLAPGTGESTRTPRDTVVLHGEGLNFREWYLEGVDGAGIVTVLAEIDQAQGADALKFNRVGDAMEPDAGTLGTQAPFIMRRTYEGGHARLAGGVPRKIRHITSGRWVYSGLDAAAWPVVTLDGVESGDASSGNGALWAPASTTVVHLAGATFEYLRIRIPSQPTADGYFQGKFFLGYVELFGKPYDWGRAEEYEDGTTIERLEDGQESVYEAAPARRVFELSWPEGVISAGIGDDPDPDYVLGTTTIGALGLSTPASTAHDLHGLVEDLHGSARPCLYLPYIPAGPPDAVTLIDVRRRGTIVRVTTLPRLETLNGDEGDIELTRASIALTEIV